MRDVAYLRILYASASRSLSGLSIRDRGLLREGFAADVVVFDPGKDRVTATFFEPNQHSEGIDHVLVNGRFVVDEGKLTGALAGQVRAPAIR